MQRQAGLIRLIQAQGLLPVKTLSSLLGVSEMTVRRDLETLQYHKPNDMESPKSPSQGESYSLMQALALANEQKDNIGRFAVSLIEPNDIIIIDTGSTTARMLPHIPSDKGLSVLCYNANVLLSLRYKPGIQLLFCGGVYHPNTEMFESPEAIQFIQRTRANKVFLSAAGVHRDLGITCANTHEVPTKNAVIHSSQQRILLVDSGKFDQLRLAWFCGLEDVNTIVTDKNLPEDWQQIIQDKGIELYMV